MGENQDPNFFDPPTGEITRNVPVMKGEKEETEPEGKESENMSPESAPRPPENATMVMSHDQLNNLTDAITPTTGPVSLIDGQEDGAEDAPVLPDSLAEPAPVPSPSAMGALRRLAGAVDADEVTASLRTFVNGDEVDDNALPSTRTLCLGILRYLAKARPGDTELIISSVLQALADES